MRTQLLLGLILLCCLTSPGFTAETAGDEVLTGPSPKVQEMIEAFQLQVVDYDYVSQAIGNGTRKGAQALLIDARPNAKYVKGTIPSSLNLPDTKFDEFYPQLESIDKTREVIVFCGGWECGKSPKVANMLKQKGFTDVKVYQAGEPEWSEKSYLEVGTEVVQAAQEKNSAVIIDARPHKKYLQATIPGAMSIPDTEMETLAGRFPSGKDEKIITFCGGYDCGKSHKVAKKLLSMGYRDVTVYAGGLPQWQDESLATTASPASASPAAPTAEKIMTANGIRPGADEGTIEGEWFKDLIMTKAVPENVQIVSVVPQEDFANGHLEGAINIHAEPLTPEELYENLPRNKVIVFSCTSGSRALEAWYKLNDAKLDTSNIYYFDAKISCTKNTQCDIEVFEPLG